MTHEGTRFATEKRNPDRLSHWDLQEALQDG